MFDAIFSGRKPDAGRLKELGFQKTDNGFEGDLPIPDGALHLEVTIDPDGQVRAICRDVKAKRTISRQTDKEKAAIKEAMESLAARGFVPDVFDAGQAGEICAWVLSKYDAYPEYLWAEFPDYAIFRRKDTGKWFGLLAEVEKSRLGLPGKDKAVILDVHGVPEVLEKQINHQTIFPGWHMNKEHWASLLLDAGLPMDTIEHLLDESWQLAE